MIDIYLKRIGFPKLAVITLASILVLSSTHWINRTAARIQSGEDPTEDLVVLAQVKGRPFTKARAVIAVSGRDNLHFDEVIPERELGNTGFDSLERAAGKFPSDRLPERYQQKEALNDARTPSNRYLPGIVSRRSTALAAATNVRSTKLVSGLSSTPKNAGGGAASKSSGPMPLDLAPTPPPSEESQAEEPSIPKLVFSRIDDYQVDVQEKMAGVQDKHLAVQLTDAGEPFVLFEGDDGREGWTRIFEALFALTQNLDGFPERTTAGVRISKLDENSDLRILGVEQGDTLALFNDVPFTAVTSDELVTALKEDTAGLTILRGERTLSLVLYRYDSL